VILRCCPEQVILRGSAAGSYMIWVAGFYYKHYNHPFMLKYPCTSVGVGTGSRHGIKCTLHHIHRSSLWSCVDLRVICILICHKYWMFALKSLLLAESRPRHRQVDLGSSLIMQASNIYYSED